MEIIIIIMHSVWIMVLILFMRIITTLLNREITIFYLQTVFITIKAQDEKNFSNCSYFCIYILSILVKISLNFKWPTGIFDINYEYNAKQTYTTQSKSKYANKISNKNVKEEGNKK